MEGAANSYGIQSQFVPPSTHVSDATDFVDQEMWEVTNAGESTWIEAGLNQGHIDPFPGQNSYSFFWADNRAPDGSNYHEHLFNPDNILPVSGHSYLFRIWPHSVNPNNWYVSLTDNSSGTTITNESTNDPTAHGYDGAAGSESTCTNSNSNQWSSNPQFVGLKVLQGSNYVWQWGWTSAAYIPQPDPTMLANWYSGYTDTKVVTGQAT
jgi:hypothetical protein